MNVLDFFRRRFGAAVSDESRRAEFEDAVRPATDPKFGDYQANGAMALAKAVKRNPREIAQEIAARVDLAPMAGPPELAGPGFLNVRVLDAAIEQAVSALMADDRLGLETPERPKTVVVDYSSPNVAKPMHVGHIRSTIIGESLARTLAALGHKVIKDNHLGDWGAQFGMILWGYKNLLDLDAYRNDPVIELARLYKEVQSRIKPAESLEERFEKAFRLHREGKGAEAAEVAAKIGGVDGPAWSAVLDQHAAAVAVRDAAREETAKLHAGDDENRRLWAEFMPHCLKLLEVIYDRLDVRFDVQLGESFYDPMLADVVVDLEAKGLATSSEGATVCFCEATKAPMMVRKRDGAYTYATTDLATIRYRAHRWNPDQVLYVVDHRQGDHFQQLFETARRWGFDKADYRHVAFGTILDQQGRPLKTREGDAVGLSGILDEAVAVARGVVDENSPDLPPDERAKVAEIVGIGAVKYADLSQNRSSDYKFDLPKMMAMNGNTATYIQYAYARIRSILRKAEADEAALRSEPPAIRLGTPEERALGMRLLRLPETLEQSTVEMKPNVVADYLFTLANEFSAFYAACPVMREENESTRRSRLALCLLTGRTLKFGLSLLGIEVVERM
jgi:arginyl-tRNA synthetase